MQTRALPYAGLAALKIISKSLPDSLGGKALRREFARKMVGMRGLPMKMAQILSMSKNEAIAGLQKEALMEVACAPRYEVMARLQEIAPKILNEMNHFNEKGIVASLGQVHQVTMQDGRSCALKIRHAGIDPAMDLDQSLMSFLVSVFGQFREGFSISEYQKLLTEELRWELDYPYEVRRQMEIYTAFTSVTEIIIPKPYPEDSGKEHLLMDWEPSQPIEEFAKTANASEKKEAIHHLIQFHLLSLFQVKMAHADPNPGNFGLRKRRMGVELVVYDYGSLIPMEPNLVDGILNLIQTIRKGQDPLPSLLGMGFTAEPLMAIQPKLTSLCQILLEPFIQEGEISLKTWNRSQRVKELLGPERWNFMIAAPPSIFFIIRALHGLFHYAEILGGQFLINPILSRILDQKRIDGNLELPCTQNPNQPDKNFEEKQGIPVITKLHIVISRNNETLVSLTLPGDAVERLESLMDPELVLKLENEKIDLIHIAESARRNQFRAMALFEQDWGEKRVKVFLA